MFVIGRSKYLFRVNFINEDNLGFGLWVGRLYGWIEDLEFFKYFKIVKDDGDV